MSKLPYEVARDRQWDLVDVVAVEHAVARTDRTLRQVLQPQVGARTKHKQSDADPLKLQNHKTKILKHADVGCFYDLCTHGYLPHGLFNGGSLARESLSPRTLIYDFMAA